MIRHAKHFNGPSYDQDLDRDRLLSQHERVRDLMIDGEWRTLGEIARILRAPEASVSAQLRHLRKERFGEFRVNRRRRGDRDAGLWEYQLLNPLDGMEQSGQLKFL